MTDDLPAPETPPAELTEVERHTFKSVREIRYGTVQFVVHDGRVVHVQKAEKLRFDTSGRPIDRFLS